MSSSLRRNEFSGKGWAQQAVDLCLADAGMCANGGGRLLLHLALQALQGAERIGCIADTFAQGAFQPFGPSAGQGHGIGGCAGLALFLACRTRGCPFSATLAGLCAYMCRNFVANTQVCHDVPPFRQKIGVFQPLQSMQQETCQEQLRR